MAEFLGIVAGHMYYFLKFTYPQEHGGPQLLNTPEFLCALHHFVFLVQLVNYYYFYKLLILLVRY